MASKRPNQVEVYDEDRPVLFTADFGMVVAVNDAGRDVGLIYADLANGLYPAKDIRTVLECAGPEGLDAPGLINRYGVQECAELSKYLLSAALIGDIKKLKALGPERTRALLESMAVGSRWRNLPRLGALWAATSLASTALVCLIFKISGLPIF